MTVRSSPMVFNRSKVSSTRLGTVADGITKSRVLNDLGGTCRTHNAFMSVTVSEFLCPPSIIHRVVGLASSKAIAIAHSVIPIAGVRCSWPAAEKTLGIFLENGDMITDVLKS